MLCRAPDLPVDEGKTRGEWGGGGGGSGPDLESFLGQDNSRSYADIPWFVGVRTPSSSLGMEPLDRTATSWTRFPLCIIRDLALISFAGY